MRHVPQIQDTINTCPDVRKWYKAFPNYMFDFKPSLRVDTGMIDEIVTQFTGLSSSPVQCRFYTQL